MSGQFDLFGAVPCADDIKRQVKTATGSGRCFIRGNCAALFVGTVRLDQYLRDLG